MTNLCSTSKALLAVFAMLLFIFSIAAFAVSRLLSQAGIWRVRFVFISKLMAGVAIGMIIIYLAMPLILGWIIGPGAVADPCMYDPYYDVGGYPVCNSSQENSTCLICAMKPLAAS
jgi:hypothetical protein